MTESKDGSAVPSSVSDAKVESTQPNTTEQERKDAVAYETYKRVLGEKKKLEERYEAMMAENSTLKDAKLESEGKTLELLDSTKKRLSETENRFKKAVGSFSYRLVSSAISQEAAKVGCTNVQDLIALSDLSGIEVDDDFAVSTEQVRDLVDKQRRERPYLFAKTAAKANVGAGVSTPDTAFDMSKLSLTEQAKLAFSQPKKG
jgi:hypothetical protein